MFDVGAGQGSCAAAGHNNGCCVGGTTACAVRVSGQKPCYCDEECFARSDCCSDIRTIGCIREGLITPICIAKVTMTVVQLPLVLILGLAQGVAVARGPSVAQKKGATVIRPATPIMIAVQMFPYYYHYLARRKVKDE